MSDPLRLWAWLKLSEYGIVILLLLGYLSFLAWQALRSRRGSRS